MSERQVTRWCDKCKMSTSWLFSGSMKHGFCEYCDTPNKPVLSKGNAEMISMLRRNDVVRFCYDGATRVGRVDGIQSLPVYGSPKKRRYVITVQLTFDKGGEVPVDEKRFKSFFDSEIESLIRL